MSHHDSPDMSALALGHCTPPDSCANVRQIPPVIVTHIICS